MVGARRTFWERARQLISLSTVSFDRHATLGSPSLPRVSPLPLPPLAGPTSRVNSTAGPLSRHHLFLRLSSISIFIYLFIESSSVTQAGRRSYPVNPEAARSPREEGTQTLFWTFSSSSDAQTRRRRAQEGKINRSICSATVRYGRRRAGGVPSGGLVVFFRGAPQEAARHTRHPPGNC